MTSAQWTKVSDLLPERDKLCETISKNGVQQKLRYIDGLWFHADRQCYVYYEVEFWRYAHEGAETDAIHRDWASRYGLTGHHDSY